jgi:DNA-binding CsgD family transcriptional regulator
MVNLAAGDAADAREEFRRSWSAFKDGRGLVDFVATFVAEAELACGGNDTARAIADDCIAVASSSNMAWHLGLALIVRARVALADEEPEVAEDFAHRALPLLLASRDKVRTAQLFELLAAAASRISRSEEAARLFGATDSLRRSIGAVRFKTYDAWYESAVSATSAAMGEEEFNRAREEGAALSLDDAVAYAQRGRGQRKRPTTGWASLTPAELDVVRLVADGLANKEIADKLFISPRTVQAHLTHVYAKLGTSSRVQLAKEAATRA